METRHTMHRSLRSAGTAPKQEPLRSRSRSRSVGLNITKSRVKGTPPLEAEKRPSTDDKPRSSTSNQRVEDAAPPQTDSRASPLSRSPPTRRARLRDRGLALHSRKSRVDWSRNVEVSSDEPTGGAPTESSPCSAPTLRSRSGESPSQSPSAKLLDTACTASRLKSQRVRHAANSLSVLTPAAQSPQSARLKADDIEPSPKESTSLKSKTTPADDAKKPGRLCSLRSSAVENTATTSGQTVAGASRRSQSVPSDGETGRQGKEARSGPASHSLTGSSPVKRTRQARQTKASPAKPDDNKNVRDHSVPAPVVESCGASEADATCSEHAEGDADSVTRPRLCSSSSPESDHNYAKPEVADDACSSKLAVIGRSPGSAGPLSVAAPGGDGPADQDDSEAEVGVDSGGVVARRVLRRHMARHSPLKHASEPSPKAASCKGSAGSEAQSGRECESGKALSTQSAATSPPPCACPESANEPQSKTTSLHTPRVLKKTQHFGTPNKVCKSPLKSIRQRNINSKYVLQRMKAALTQEGKSKKGLFDVDQAKHKVKSQSKPSKLSAGSMLSNITEVRKTKTSVPERKLDRNLFEEFSKSTVTGVCEQAPVTGDDGHARQAKGRVASQSDGVVKSHTAGQANSGIRRVTHSANKQRKPQHEVGTVSAASLSWHTPGTQKACSTDTTRPERRDSTEHTRPTRRPSHRADTHAECDQARQGDARIVSASRPDQKGEQVAAAHLASPTSNSPNDDASESSVGCQDPGHQLAVNRASRPSQARHVSSDVPAVTRTPQAEMSDGVRRGAQSSAVRRRPATTGPGLSQGAGEGPKSSANDNPPAVDEHTSNSKKEEGDGTRGRSSRSKGNRGRSATGSSLPVSDEARTATPAMVSRPLRRGSLRRSTISSTTGKAAATKEPSVQDAEEQSASAKSVSAKSTKKALVKTVQKEESQQTETSEVESNAEIAQTALAQTVPELVSEGTESSKLNESQNSSLTELHSKDDKIKVGPSSESIPKSKPGSTQRRKSGRFKSKRHDRGGTAEECGEKVERPVTADTKSSQQISKEPAEKTEVSSAPEKQTEGADKDDTPVESDAVVPKDSSQQDSAEHEQRGGGSRETLPEKVTEGEDEPVVLRRLRGRPRKGRQATSSEVKDQIPAATEQDDSKAQQVEMSSHDGGAVLSLSADAKHATSEISPAVEDKPDSQGEMRNEDDAPPNNQSPEPENCDVETKIPSAGGEEATDEEAERTPDVTLSSEGTERITDMTASSEGSETRRRGRPRRPLAAAGKLPDTTTPEPPAPPRTEKDEPAASRAVPRWKIPPPSPIRTRRLSRETQVSKMRIAKKLKVSKKDTAAEIKERPEEKAGLTHATSSTETAQEKCPEELPTDNKDPNVTPVSAASDATKDVSSDPSRETREAQTVSEAEVDAPQLTSLAVPAEEEESDTKAPAELKSVSKASAELESMAKASAEFDSVTTASAELESVTNTPAELELVTKTSAELELVTKTSADLELVTKASADLESVPKASVGLEGITKASGEEESIPKALAEFDSVTKDAAELESVPKAAADVKSVTDAPAEVESVTKDSAEVETVDSDSPNNCPVPVTPIDAQTVQDNEVVSMDEKSKPERVDLKEETSTDRPDTENAAAAILEESKVEELQVPYHDTDEAELSESLSRRKNQESAAVDQDEGEALKLYLEVDPHQKEEPKESTPTDIRAVSPCQQGHAEDSNVGNKLILKNEQEEDSKTDVKVQRPATPRESSDNLTLKEDTEVESILQDVGTHAPVEKVHGSDPIPDDSPSKSEWCARKVTTGMKIVLKLKRKGSSDRAENSAPSTPTFADQKPKSPAVTEAKVEKKEKADRPASVKLYDTVQDPPSLALTEASCMIEAWKKRRKKRRNEVEMLSVIDRAKRKCEEGDIMTAATEVTDSEVSGFTSDSTLATQSSLAEKDSLMKSLDAQQEVKLEPKEEVKLDPTEPSVSGLGEQADRLPPAEQHQKVEKLVIKRRVPSPTKMKTRGKQNKLWYLFAKQSKPSKELVMSQVNRLPKVTPTGTLEELQALCRPCSVRLVDIIECLDIVPNEGSPTQAPTSELDEVNLAGQTDADGGSPQTRTSPEREDAGEEAATPSIGQAAKRKRSPGVPSGEETAEAGSRTITIPLPHEESSNSTAKKGRFSQGTEYQTQYLSFIMQKSPPNPVLDRSTWKSDVSAEGTTKVVAPKPVLTRAPITARKSMKSASRNKTCIRSGEVTPPPRCLTMPDMAAAPGLDRGQISPGVSSPGKFACRQCPYTSNVRSVMLEHVYVHTDVVPYACGHCNEAYGSRNGVVIHTKREHPGMPPDIVKNTEVCEEDYYVTCDASKRLFPDEPQAAAAKVGQTSSGKSVSLLNPALLTAQVAATRVGLVSSGGKSISPKPPVQLVVSTSRPTSTAPVVNVVAQVDSTGTTLQVPPKGHACKERAVTDGSKKVKIPRRPRIPSLVNVDPSQPYYQCRHCTLANNSLASIKSHVEVKHKGEQCYQCQTCELVFFKNSMAIEKHYAKHHPGQPVVHALQADFYDVHQNHSDKSRLTVEPGSGQQTRGQSPLHVIVSPDGVTLLGVTDVSPASTITSTVSLPTATRLVSPGPAHCRPSPVLSPGGAGLTPPPAHGGSPPSVSPRSLSAKPGPACSKLGSKSGRVILRVPTISPPQRAPRAPPTHDSPALSPAPASTGSDTVLNLTTSSTDASPCLDLTKRAAAATTSATPSETASDTPSEVAPAVTETADEEMPETDVAESLDMAQTVDVSQTDTADEPSRAGPQHSPPPLMIMNVMSLAGHEDADLYPDKSIENSDDAQLASDEPASHEPSVESEIVEVFTCTSCEATFTELTAVIEHVSKIHKLQYWYSCPYCPYACSWTVGCSWSKMFEHINRSHSDKPSDVPITITDEEKYFTRSRQLSGADSHPRGESSGNSQTDIDVELDVESEQVKDKADSDPTSAVPPLGDSVHTEKPGETEVPGETGQEAEPRTSEKGCSTDDIPCKQPPVPTRLVQQDEEDVVIVAEHRKQRPVGQIRPTMVRAPVGAGFKRLGSGGSFQQQQVQPVSPIRTEKAAKPVVDDLEMDCENIDEPCQIHDDVTEDDDVIITETQSSVITIPAMDQPLDLHQSVHDEPTDLTVSRTNDQPQDLSVPHHLSRRPADLSRSASSSPSVITATVIQPRGGLSSVGAIRSPPPAHQSVRRAVPPLVIEPIQNVTSPRSGQSWAQPIMIAPLPQSSKDSPRQPLPAHSHNRSARYEKDAALNILSAQAGAPSLPSSHRPGPAVTGCPAPPSPITKTIPPLVQIAPHSDKGHNRHPPPLIHVGSSHGALGPAKTVRNSASVIQAVPSASQPSALSSLEMMTRRSGHDTGSKRPFPGPASKGFLDEEFSDEEAARKAYSVFNLKPRMRHLPRAVVPGSHRSQPFTGPPGINKWRQFQSQNRPLLRPQPPFHARPGMSAPRPGSLGMAAAAFQQAHLRRAGVSPAQPPSMPQVASAAGAAASFLQRPTGPASQTFPGADKTANIPCPYCPFEAEDPDTIHNHILSHAPNIQWSCPYCPMPNRMTKALVTKHMQNCHPNSKVVYIPYGVPFM